MREKIKKWLGNNRKDIKTLSILFVIGSFLSLVKITDIDNPLWSGFAFAFSGAVVINAYRYWKKWLKRMRKMVE